MSNSNATIFLSGRLTALVVLVAFQIVLVRELSAGEYGRYALVFGVFALLQNVVSFGIPRVISKFLSQAGWGIANVRIRRLTLSLLALRLIATLACLAIGHSAAWGLGLAQAMSLQLMIVGAAFVVATIIQLDLDMMVQALGLQAISRSATVGEAVCRFLIVAGLALGGHLTSAADVFAVSLATSLPTSAILLRAVLHRLARPDESAEAGQIDTTELRATALGGYASSMAWFASSPSVIRLIGSYLLQIQAFAAFAFSQALVLSIQRYTPASLLFPFVEPTVMRHFARTGDQTRLESAMSILIKFDLLVIGAGIVMVVVAGEPLVDLMTGGKYGVYAYAIPWLLAYIASNSIYRSFEIVAITLGAGGALIRTLSLSLVWVVAAVFLTREFGLIALLVCPVADAACRLAMVFSALHGRGIRKVVDLRIVLAVCTIITITGIAGLSAALMIDAGPLARIALGLAATLAYLALSLAIKPIRSEEIDIFESRADTAPLRMARRLSRA